MACCSNPKPKVLEKNGRLFCDNCKHYLDKRREDQPVLPATPPPDVIVEKEVKG